MTTITFDMERRHPAPAVPERFGPGRALRHAAAIAGRNLKHLVRNPMALVFIAIQPIMLVLLFNYVFGGAIKAIGVRYIEYLIPGVMVQTLIFSSSFSGMGITQDLASGALDRPTQVAAATPGRGRGRGLGRRRRCAERGVLGENGLLDPPELQAGSRPACSASARRTRW